MFMLIYIVKERDSVDSIAQEYGILAESIVYINQIPPPYALAVGQALLLSEGSLKLPEEKTAAYVGGYAYPFASRWVLEQTLPYLTYLYIFSYGFTADGNLIPPLVDDLWMINLAKSFGVSPVLTLTPFGLDGRFNNSLISSVVNDLTVRANLKNQIVQQIRDRGFEGLDIDFEYILAQDRNAFVDFVAYMQESISALGYLTSVALAPKTSDNQPGLLYEGKDYRALGMAADYVLLMTYEWGYKYGPPMSVAPYNKVREVLDYAVTVISPQKIHLGIPNYGYDWPLPFVQSVTEAETIGNIQAVQRAISYGVPIRFDEVAQSPFYFYSDGEIQHEVWFEDVRSMSASFGLMEEYGLRGASYWTVMQLFRANWLLLSDFFWVQ